MTTFLTVNKSDELMVHLSDLTAPILRSIVIYVDIINFSCYDDFDAHRKNCLLFSKKSAEVRKFMFEFVTVEPLY